MGYCTLREDVSRLCRLPKSASWKLNACVGDLGLQAFLIYVLQIPKSNQVAFPSSLHPRHAHPRSKASLSEKCNVVFRTINIEMSFQSLVKKFYFLIGIFTSFQVGICLFSLQSTAERYSKAPKAHPLLNLGVLSLCSSHF